MIPVNFKNRLLSMFLLILFALGAFGCSHLERLGDVLKDNQDVIVDAAVRQAVFKYVDAADTAAEKGQRAIRVAEVAKKVDKVLDADADVSTAAIMSVIDTHIDWTQVDDSDQALIKGILGAIESRLQQRQREGVVSEDAVIGLKHLLKTVIKTAQLL